MKQHLPLTFMVSLLASVACGQAYSFKGRITNATMEGLAFVSIQVKGFSTGNISNESGNFSLQLDPGKYEIVFSIIGYKPRVITVVIEKQDYVQNIIMEQDHRTAMSEITISATRKDRSEEIIRKVIRNKDSIRAAAGAYSTEVYIKAVQQEPAGKQKPARKKPGEPEGPATNDTLERMAMAEIFLKLDVGKGNRLREQRLGITKRGNVESLFYLSATEGNFDFYNNLIDVPSVLAIPILSPFSYSGLIAYKYRLVRTIQQAGRKLFVISVRPTTLSNATVEGEVTIADSIWVIVHTKLKFPVYHLTVYDFFEVEQHYEQADAHAWMINRQKFTYHSKAGKYKKTGTTIVSYKNFELNKTFDKKHFGTEVSASSAQAYETDSLFWEKTRTEALTEKELRFIQYKDSIHRATHTVRYLDSMDQVLNRITWKKLFLSGLSKHDHRKESVWYFPSLLAMYQPLQFGGTRILLTALHRKTYPSRKNLELFANLSYGLRNMDVNGGIQIKRMYNPFNRGFYTVKLERNFEYIFQGDAWINLLKRNNIYLNNFAGVGYGRELLNGLSVSGDIDVAFRRSVGDYKTNPRVDSLFGDVLTDNVATSFEAYNAVYGKLRVQYTPAQRYIREPKEKIILGSRWPTFYTMWRKGLPRLLGSKVNFDYLEFGIEQYLKLGLAGVSNYTIRTGSFLNRKDLKLVDYQFQRRGDPLFFLNPHDAFQALDSSFPVFKRFYQGHLTHEFNGSIINRVPLLKKLRLREIAGAGFLVAPERNLRYAEVFTGIERIFNFPFNIPNKFKFGVYVVGSAANQFRNPVQFKVGVTTWDKRRGRWF